MRLLGELCDGLNHDRLTEERINQQIVVSSSRGPYRWDKQTNGPIHDYNIGYNTFYYNDIVLREFRKQN